MTAIALAMVLVAAVLGWAVPSASAATSGTLTFTPLTGTDLSRSTIRTASPSAPKGCPTGTAFIGSTITQLSRADGVPPSGKWTTGEVVGFQVKSAGFSTTADFSVQLADTWKGLATANAVALVAGRYQVTLNCLDDFASTVLGSFTGSVWFTSPTAFQWFNPNAPVVTTTVTASPAGSANAGAPVSLTAQLSPSAVGTVQFRDTVGGATSALGPPVTVVGGTATLSNLTSLASGSHSFSAVFTPTVPAGFQPSTSGETAYTIVAAGAPTTTALVASPAATAALGDAVTLTATVDPAEAAGSVQFRTTLGGVTTNLGSPVAVAAGQAVTTVSNLAWGAQTLSAVFVSSDTTAYVGSTSGGVAYAVTGVQPTTTGLTGPTSRVAPSTTFALNATVSPASAAGSVSFADTFGGVTTPLGSSPVSGGIAQLSTSFADAGLHSVVATFVPTDATQYAATSSGAIPVDIGALDTVTTLQVDPAGGVAPGASFTLTAGVAPAAAGSVSFSDTVGGATTELGTAAVTDGTASLTTSLSAVGTHSVIATFTPTDPTKFAGSASIALPLSVAVPAVNLGLLTFSPSTGKDTTRSTVTTASTGADKGCPAATTIYSAKVVGPGAWAPGYLVRGATAIGAGTSRDFSATLADTWLGIAELNSLTIVPGKYTVTLSCLDDTGSLEFGYFSGSVWFVDATSYLDTDPETTSRPTTIALTESPLGYSEVSKPLTLTATVAPGTAVGKVQFRITSNGTTSTLGAAVTVVGGKASLTTSSLAFGLYDLSAEFVPGNPAKFEPSTSVAVPHAIRLPAPPMPAMLPTVSGTPKQGAVLTCSRGSWTNSPTAYAVAWLRGTAVIPGARGLTYRTVAADGGRAVTCRVTATNLGGSITRQATAVTIPLTAAPVRVTAPTYSGTFTVKKKVRVTAGRWRPSAVTVRYQWLLGGRSIPGATSASFRIPTSAKGKFLSVQLRVSRVGTKAAVVVVKRVKVR